MLVCSRVARSWLGAAIVAIAPLGSSAEVVTVDRFAEPRLATDTVRDTAALAPILDACLFEDSSPAARISPRTFALECVVPYIHGLWLDPKILYRSHANIVEQATDKLVQHPAGKPFPIFYPQPVADPVESALKSAIGPGDVTLEPLPDPLPTPSLDPESLYNNIGLLYLPNPYVVPGDTFNEMYGWDSFFIIEGLLASVDHVMHNPIARVWSAENGAFYQLTTDPDDEHYYRAFAKRLFDTAKGMVDNHIFEIAFYGGFVLNANRTYYLTRSQPPLFTREALAVLRSALAYGFDYVETLAPYLAKTDPGFDPPRDFQAWIAREVLPAAQSYYAYWTDPQEIPAGSATNPRVVSVVHRGKPYPVYLYGTAGVGPAPEVARSTQPQNRKLYQRYADTLNADPAANPDHLFYNPGQICRRSEPVDGCGDPRYGLTQAFYAADRAIRASGFDLSGRFGTAGQWAMHYAPISLNVLLLRMAEDIDALSLMVGDPAPHGDRALESRRRFLVDFFARENGTYGDRFVAAEVPAGVERFAYPYATQTYLLWADALSEPGQAYALVHALQQKGPGGAVFLAPPEASQLGIPSSLVDTGMQWDAPFAWAPIQYFAVEGLLANAFASEATVAMAQWIAAVNAFFAETAVLIEKYDSTDPTADPRARVGYGQTQRGFGWTNAVYLLFVNRLYGG